MHATEALKEADRLMTVCNSCRYCEGLCAVFPAMEMRRSFADGSGARNMYAAGEIMAGNILGQGYIAGFGMTIGTVFGRIAGKEAAAHVAG